MRLLYLANELLLLVRRSKSIAKDSSSRGIMRLAPLFILEAHNQTNDKCLLKIVQTENASLAVKKRPQTKYPSGRIMRPPAKVFFFSAFLFSADCFLISCIVSRLLVLTTMFITANKKWIASPKLSHYAMRPSMTHSYSLPLNGRLTHFDRSSLLFFLFPEVISLSKNIFVCRMLNVTGKSY